LNPVNKTATDLNRRPDLVNETLVLIEKHFPGGSPVSRNVLISEEFPLLLDSTNHHRVVIHVNEQDQVTSVAAWRPFEVRSRGTSLSLKVAGVGLVVTDPTFRGQGLSSLVQSEIEKRAQAENMALSVLWSDLSDFYLKRGYQVSGSEIQWHLEAPALQLLRTRLRNETTASKNIEIRPLNHFQDVLPLYQKCGMGPIRDPALYTRFLKLPETLAWSAHLDGSTLGYLCMGKARDLRNTVHELVGDPRCVGPLLDMAAQNIREGTLHALRVQQPLGSPLRDELEHWLGPAELAPLAFFKILNFSLWAQWMKAFLPAGQKIEGSAESPFTLSDAQGVFFESDDSSLFLSLLMGPEAPSQMAELHPLLREKLKTFRVPSVYFWGFDSV
jgi:hypothetical protein